MGERIKKIMKHLKDIAENFSNPQYVVVDGNKITFTIQDGVIGTAGVNGIQASDMILFLRELFIKLNNDIPCRENVKTIDYLDEAWNWQMRREINRKMRKVEGTEKP